MAATNTHRVRGLVFDISMSGLRTSLSGCRTSKMPLSERRAAAKDRVSYPRRLAIAKRTRLPCSVARSSRRLCSVRPRESRWIRGATNAHRARGPVFDITSVSELRTLMSARRTLNAPSPRDVDLRPRRGETPLTVASRVGGVSLSRGVPVARARSPCSARSNEAPQLREPVATVDRCTRTRAQLLISRTATSISTAHGTSPLVEANELLSFAAEIEREAH